MKVKITLTEDVLGSSPQQRGTAGNLYFQQGPDR